MRKLLFLFLLFAAPAYGANSVFLTQSGGGAGTSCGSPQSFAYFNNAANWSATPTGVQIGPDTTVHICSGTYTATISTTLLTFQGNGTSGHPVTLLFDSGAVLSSPKFQNSFNGSPCGGAISICGRSFVTIDGGTNGTIQNTANGDLLANQAGTTAVDFYSASNIKILRLTVNNMYVHLQNNTTLGGGNYSDMRVFSGSGSNNEIAFNTVDQCGWCFYYQYANGDTTNRIHDNFIGHYAHAIMYATTGHGSHGQDIFIYNNHFQTTRNWSVNPPSCPGHQDGIHMFGKNTTGGAQSTMDGQYIYNNLFDGQMGGGCDTGNIFIEAGSLTTGTPSTATSTYVWNNIFDASGSIVGGGGTGTGWCSIFGHNETGGSGTHVWNNTLIYNGDVDNGQGYNIGSVDNLFFQGNVSWKISMGANIGTLTNTPASQIDYNTYAGACTGNCFIQNGSFKSTFAAWKSGLGWDTHSQAPTNAAVLLNADGSPQAGSLVIKQSINLNSLATGNLSTLSSDTTKGGSRTPLTRPSGTCTSQGIATCPEQGAFQFASGGAPAASTPTPTPAAGSYAPTKSVTLATTSGGAIICYTINGTTPATNGTTGCTTGTLYSGAITVATTTTIKAVAGGTGFTDSSVGSYLFTITGAALPTASPIAGSYGPTQNVTLSSTAFTVICYTTNGTTPATNGGSGCTTGTLYSTPISVSSSQTIKAIAGGTTYFDSAVASFAYVINGTAATPTYSPVAGTYAGTVNVTITTSSGPLIICYTLDGSTPTATTPGVCSHGTTYSAPVAIASTATLKAIATSPIWINSGVASGLYTITPAADTPTFSPVAGTYAVAQNVTISSTTSGATICYTTNGTTPTADGAGTCTNGTTYTVPVSVSTSLTLQAVASKSGNTDSSVGAATYNIGTSPVAPIPILVSLPLPAQPIINSITVAANCSKSCPVTIACTGCSSNSVVFFNKVLTPAVYTPGGILTATVNVSAGGTFNVNVVNIN